MSEEAKLNKEDFDSPISYIQSELLGHCQCGMPEKSLKFIHKVLGQLSIIDDARRSDRKWSEIYKPLYEKLGSFFYNNDGLMFTFFYMLDKYGLIEHGSNVAVGWLNERGLELLEELNKVFPQQGGKEK